MRQLRGKRHRESKALKSNLVAEEIRDVAKKVLGDAGQCLVDSMPPWIPSLDHLPVIEHMLCEAYKCSHPEGRAYDYDASQGMGETYRSLLERLRMTQEDHRAARLPRSNI